MATDIATRKPESLQMLLEQMKPQIAMALPRHMSAERMIRVVLTAVQKTPALKACTILSIIGAVVQASQLGLEPDDFRGEAYLVPYQNKKTGLKEAQLQIGYRGLITLARRSGEISNIYSELVFDCDEFHVQLGTDKKLKHVPDYENPERGASIENGELVGVKGAYAVVKFKDETSDFEYMPLAELERIRLGSRARESGPWVTHPAEMYRKCPIRRLAKRLPLSPELMRAAVHDEYVEAGVAVSATELVDLDEPIIQDTSSPAVAAKGERTIQTIKEQYAKPEIEVSEAAKPEVKEAAAAAQQKLDEKRKQSKEKAMTQPTAKELGFERPRENPDAEPAEEKEPF